MPKQTQGGNIAHCTRCGLKHARPVGARCKTNLNVSAPAFTDALGEEQQQDQGSNLHPESSNVVTTQSSTIKDPASQVESKLDLILHKMHELENKNSRLEKRLDEQSMSAGSKPQPAHSSPKRSHRCSARGDPGFHRKRRMVNTRKQVTGDDLSDEDLTDFSHPRASSTQMSALSDNETSKEMPYLQFLKENEKIQKRVQKQLKRLQGQPRGTTSSGNKTIKSQGRVLDCDNLIQWACEAHTIVAATKCPNYRVARIKVPTELNIDNWRALCGNFHDQILLDYLEYGFPLCVDRNNFIHNASVTNHSSATQFPHDVDIYFEKKLKHKAIVGPRPAFPFPVHYSPLLSRPKPDDTRRIIVNLSFPYGDSVNDRISNAIYDGANFQLKYPSVDNIVEAIHELGPDVLLSKIDVSRAFRNLRVDPADFDLLGLSWKGGLTWT